MASAFLFSCRLARFFTSAAVICLLAALSIQGIEAQRPDSSAEAQARIDRLIQQLDDDKFEVREKAAADLVDIGEPAIAKLAVASKDAAAERSQRAAKILEHIRRSGLKLRYSSGLIHHGLSGAVTFALSGDGRFAYVPGWKTSSINVLRRDLATGALEYQGAVADREKLGGVLVVRLSPDGKQAVAAAFSSKSIALLSRNVETGELALESDFQADPATGFSLEKPVDAIFSMDGKFVYAVDDRRAAVVVLEVDRNKRLNLVQALHGPDRCFDGARGVTPHPDGKTLYVTSFRAGTLSVLDRDPATGKVSLRQILTDEQEGVHGLGGAMLSVVTRDGKFVYTTSGRFGGDNAVGVYQVGPDGKLTVLQEFINETSDLRDFTGGNQLILSPDEKEFYASATTSCALACFRRDTVDGKLSYTATIRSEATGAEKGLGANGLQSSTDGRFLYLTLEDVGGVSVFERSQSQP